jgi:hypothetical protein
MLIFINEGFPEFARFFNHSHLWKLQINYSRMLCH